MCLSLLCPLYQIPAACLRTCVGQSPGTLNQHLPETKKKKRGRQWLKGGGRLRFLCSLSGAAWVRGREGSLAPSGEGAVYKVGVEGRESEKGQCRVQGVSHARGLRGRGGAGTGQ